MAFIKIYKQIYLNFQIISPLTNFEPLGVPAPTAQLFLKHFNRVWKTVAAVYGL